MGRETPLKAKQEEKSSVVAFYNWNHSQTAKAWLVGFSLSDQLFGGCHVVT
jgi:hypothetical protein